LASDAKLDSVGSPLNNQSCVEKLKHFGRRVRKKNQSHCSEGGILLHPQLTQMLFIIAAGTMTKLGSIK